MRDKIKMVIKRYAYILTAIKKGQKVIYIRRYRERIKIDEEVKMIVEIVQEIVESEEKEWLKSFYQKILKGESDISILMGCPIERGKYYQTKKSFFHKVYECCICKGLVSYEEILKVDIG